MLSGGFLEEQGHQDYNLMTEMNQVLDWKAKVSQKDIELNPNTNLKARF